VKGSLFHILDRTVTPMGAASSGSGSGIRSWTCGRSGSGWRRLRASGRKGFQEEVREHLEGILDVERLNARISMGRANARDLVALKQSSRRLPAIKETLPDLQ